MEPDKWDVEDGLTAVAKAVEFLDSEGASEPSASHSGVGVWYTASNYSENYRTGEVESRSFHLYGFTPEEEQQIFNAIGGHNRDQTKKTREGYKVVPAIDREQHPERPGLEGPYRADSGLIYYYDPKEGKYYDPSTDMYISVDDLQRHGVA